MKANEVQEYVQKMLFEQSHNIQALNYHRSGYYESDILAITKSMLVTEVEVKVSRADFFADFKKKMKHYKLANRLINKNWIIPNRFYFACPEGLIKIEEIPEYAGLIYVASFNPYIAKVAPILHREKASQRLIMGMLENLTAKTIFGCQYMTYKNRESKRIFEERQSA